MDYKILQNENWRDDHIWSLIANGEVVATSDDKMDLVRYAAYEILPNETESITRSNIT